MVTGISDIRTVPVGEDLTKEDLRLSILRGTENMYRVDKPVAAGEDFDQGEWAVLNSEGKCERPGASAVANTYLVFSGTNRFDSKATGQITLVMSHPIIVKSSYFNPLGDYAVGTPLTVKTIGGGSQAFVTPAETGDTVLARVIESNTNFLVYETLGGV
jgi:hypothetical protein